MVNDCDIGITPRIREGAGEVAAGRIVLIKVSCRVRSKGLSHVFILVEHSEELKSSLRGREIEDFAGSVHGPRLASLKIMGNCTSREGE